MKTRLIKGQLIVFSVLAALSLVYGAINYIGIQRVTGIGTYTVTADFTEAGGIYESASVTYRGVEVGRVTGVDLDNGVVKVRMQLHDGPHIPSAAAAAIKSTSAIGEQYVDLVPSDEHGPFLSDGSEIPRSRTMVPIPTSDVLDKTQALLASLSTDSLRTTLDETFQAVNGTGPALASLIESSAKFLDLAQANIGPTVTLLNDAEPLLHTGNSVRTELRSAVHDLGSFTDQLARSDSDLRGVLDQGPSAATTVTGTLADLSTPLPALLSDLQTVGQVLRVNVAGLRQVLVIYPALAAAVDYSVVGGGFQTDGNLLAPAAALDVKLGNTLNPPPCTEGFQDTQRRDPSDTGPAPVTQNAYCKIAPDDPKVIRGARNTPCASDPSVRTAEVANCPKGLPSTWPEMLAHPGDPAPAAAPPSVVPQSPVVPAPAVAPPTAAPAALTVPYAEGDGTFRGPNGLVYVLGQSAPSAAHGEENQGWQSLLIK
ncbi:MCE family protein [Nocardia nova]|uniref:MCE family protein n=1 Tax=Nocardia nova TaxID=37330 RepID=UPI0018960747|nr:MlaD family protein [Nocardia nova]MBF6149551.1 MCE family protein [Nocardia nova]